MIDKRVVTIENSDDKWAERSLTGELFDLVGAALTEMGVKTDITYQDEGHAMKVFVKIEVPELQGVDLSSPDHAQAVTASLPAIASHLTAASETLRVAQDALQRALQETDKASTNGD